MAEQKTDGSDSSDEVLAGVVEIVSEEAEAAAAQIRRESRFVEDLGMDSLGLLTVATQVEERFEVTLDDSLIPTLPTVGSLVDLVVSRRG